VSAAGAAGGPIDPGTRAADEVASDLGVDPDHGLAAAEAATRLARTGPNELEEHRPPSLLATIWDAATEPFLILLAVAGIGAVLLGETRDGLLVLAGLLPIVGADVVTSFRGERALAALRQATAPTAHVLRDGAPQEVPAASLVPGDVMLLSGGDVVGADARVLESGSLVVDRSVLTGESLPEAARATPDPPGTPLIDRRAMVYSGTSIVSGRGRAIVTATGASSELGTIAGGLGARERGRSPLQRELDRLVRILLVVAIALIVITVGLGFARGQPAGENLLAGISAAIAAIPEEPPVLLAVILGLGAYRLLKRKVLVRRLAAQETLGGVDLILTDKTGTLTMNRLEVRHVVTPDGPLTGAERREALHAAYCAEEEPWAAGSEARVDPVTRALYDVLVAEAAVPMLRPADLEATAGPAEGRPYAISCWVEGERRRESAFGAPEAILAFPLTLDAEQRRAWHLLAAEESARGGRCLLVAERDVDDAPWTPRAVVTFADALRDEVPAAMAMATAAGIATMIVTGDHPETARAVAREVGLPKGTVLTGEELAAMDDATLHAAFGEIRVVARALPEQKLRLVREARSLGRTIAVTGDGVNDAPALQQADVAVAMGSGSAVAREAADLVLGDDSFGTLMEGLREGRRMIANVRTGLIFLVSTHVALLGFILLGTLAGFGQPLLPIQILWLELFIDLSTAVAFEREPESPGAMEEPPRPRGKPLLGVDLLLKIGAAGGVSAAGALGILLLLPRPFEEARWVAFTALVVGQALRAYANRSLTLPIHRLPANVLLLAACSLVVVIQLVLPYLPPLATAFHATPLTLLEWGLVAVVGIVPAVVAQTVRTLRPGRVSWVA
jgi:Ca2+-transporting ATPase